MKFPKSKPLRSAKYLRWLHGQVCAWSERHPVEASHHPEPGHGSMGVKTDDYRAIPLAPEVHRQFHQTGCIGTLSREDSLEWIERQITRHLIRYLREMMG